MPSPVSRDPDLGVRTFAVEREMNAAAGGRELDRVRQQVPDDLLQAIGIAHHGSAVDDLRCEIDVLRLRRRPQSIDRRLDHRFELDRPEVDPELAGDDAGNVEDVGDQLFLHMGVAFDGFERARHAGRIELAHSQQPRPAEHRIERRSQFVRQRRQELFFRPVRSRELVGAAAQIDFEPFAFRDVAHHHREPARFSVGPVHRRHQDERIERAATASHPQRFAFEPASGAGDPQVLGRKAGIALAGRIETGRVTADDLVAGVAEHARRARIPADDFPIHGEHADRVILHAVEEDAHSLLLLAQPLGLIVHLRVERDDAAVRLLHLGLELQQRSPQPRVLLGKCGSVDVRRIGNALPLRPAGWRPARPAAAKPPAGGRTTAQSAPPTTDPPVRAVPRSPPRVWR